MIRSKVVLPQPLAPQQADELERPTSSEMSSSTFIARTPRSEESRALKNLYTRLTLSIACSSAFDGARVVDSARARIAELAAGMPFTRLASDAVPRGAYPDCKVRQRCAHRRRRPGTCSRSKGHA